MAEVPVRRTLGGLREGNMKHVPSNCSPGKRTPFASVRGHLSKAFEVQWCLKWLDVGTVCIVVSTEQVEILVVMA